MSNILRGRKPERVHAIIRGTGNVLADLAYPDASERQAKLQLAYVLNFVLDNHKLTVAKAARLLDVTQAHISALRRRGVESPFDRQ